MAPKQEKESRPAIREQILGELAIILRDNAGLENVDPKASLLDLGIGFTNLCTRPTRRADELSREEIRAGADDLIGKLQRYGPSAVAYTGIGVYRWFRATSKVGWGVQPDSAVQGVTDVVVPSPSGLNRMRFEELVDHYRILKPLVK